MTKEEAKNLTLSALYEALIIAMLVGIIFQLIFIPSLMLALHKTGLVKIYKKNKAKIAV